MKGCPSPRHSCCATHKPLATLDADSRVAIPSGPISLQAWKKPLNVYQFKLNLQASSWSFLFCVLSQGHVHLMGISFLSNPGLPGFSGVGDVDDWKAERLVKPPFPSLPVGGSIVGWPAQKAGPG